MLKQVNMDTAQKMKLSIKDFFSQCDQIRRKLRIWSHLLKKSLMENFIFCAVGTTLSAFYDRLTEMRFSDPFIVSKSGS